MEFKKFTSLENTYRQNIIDKIIYEGLDNDAWVVTEKVHGANFSFWYNGDTVRVASRSQFVDGTFYNCQSVINKYEQKIMNYFHENLQQGDLLVIYGELYGDGIQKEVKYGEKDFCSFDVSINGVVQDFLTTCEISIRCGIATAPLIGIYSFSDALKVERKFQSRLTPNEYEGENLAEGVTISPYKPKFFNNGNRVWLKNKTEAFSEKKNPIPKQIIELTAEENELLSKMLEYNTEQRVSNVLSKIGQVSNKDFGKVLGLTVQDIIEDFVKETGIDYKKVAEVNYKKFIKQLNSEVSDTVRVQFVKSLDE